MQLDERERVFIECHMLGYDNPIGQEIETPVTFMIKGIAKIHTHGGTWRQLVQRSDGQVGIAL